MSFDSTAVSPCRENPVRLYRAISDVLHQLKTATPHESAVLSSRLPDLVRRYLVAEGNAYFSGGVSTTHMPPLTRRATSQSDFSRLLDKIQEAEQLVRDAGQREYAHDDSDALANFNRLSVQLGIPREKVLWVFLQKHLDGIVAYLNGHRSQREDVRGRLKDARLYLALLWAMVEEDTTETPDATTHDDTTKEKV